MAHTVMEAMAAVLLVIGTRVGGQSEMMDHGQNSLTFQPEDAFELASLIYNILNDPSLRNRLARNR